MNSAISVVLIALAFGSAGAGEQTPSVPPEEAPAARSTDKIDALEAAVRRNPNDPASQYRLALALRGADRRADAFPHFVAASELAPPSSDLLLDLGIAYSDVGRYDDAEKTYRRLITLDPSNARALHNMGNLALRRGDAKEAADWYGRAVAARPAYLLAQYHLAYTQKFLGRYDDAMATYMAVLKSEPSSGREQAARTDSLYQMASIELARGAPARAEALLAEVVKIAPDHPSAHYARGQALRQLGRDDEARAEFAEHMKILASRPMGGASAGAAQ